MKSSENKVRLSPINALCICVEKSFEFWVRFELLIHRPKGKINKNALCIKMRVKILLHKAHLKL